MLEPLRWTQWLGPSTCYVWWDTFLCRICPAANLLPMICLSPFVCTLECQPEKSRNFHLKGYDHEHAAPRMLARTQQNQQHQTELLQPNPTPLPLPRKEYEHKGKDKRFATTQTHTDTRLQTSHWGPRDVVLAARLSYSKVRQSTRAKAWPKQEVRWKSAGQVGAEGVEPQDDQGQCGMQLQLRGGAAGGMPHFQTTTTRLSKRPDDMNKGSVGGVSRQLSIYIAQNCRALASSYACKWAEPGCKGSGLPMTMPHTHTHRHHTERTPTRRAEQCFTSLAPISWAISSA